MLLHLDLVGVLESLHLLPLLLFNLVRVARLGSKVLRKLKLGYS